jgi:DNA-binding transcriptional MerR regulator
MTVDNVTVTGYIVRVDEEQGRFNIDQLADLGGVSRRTVRYYVQEGLLPAPLGVGRGPHYDRSHLDRLLDVKARQEAGQSLDQIRAGRPSSSPRRQAVAARAATPAALACSIGEPGPRLPRSAWRRIELAPGIELHLAQNIRMPAEARLDELADWCRRHFSRNSEAED